MTSSSSSSSGDDHSAAYFHNAPYPLFRRTHLVAPVTAVSVVSECDRILIGRGSELESRPLLGLRRRERLWESRKGDEEVDAGEQGARGRDDSEDNDNEEEAVYRHRAFAACGGSGVIHGIRYAKPKMTNSPDSDAIATSRL